MTEIAGRVGTFSVAPKELTEIEIRRDYGALLESAVSAFREDPSYLVDMAQHASLIAYKRALWEIRMEAQRAEAAARKSCEMDGKQCPFTCSNEGACGFGECRYAQEGHKTFLVPTPRESMEEGKERPEAGVGGKYKLEETISAMMKERGVVAPARLSRGSRRKNRD